MIAILGLLLAGGALPGLAPRPPDLVPPREAGAYPAFYAQDVATFSERHVTGRCAAMRVHPLGVHLMGPITSMGAPAQVAAFDSPVYKESWAIEGCGPQAVQNMVVLHQRGGGWRGLGVAPGTTLASALLQRDAATMAAVAVSVRPPAGCSQEQAKRSQLVDTTVLLRPTGPKAPWTERWKFAACGLPKIVSLRFSPSPRGGTDIAVLP